MSKYVATMCKKAKHKLNSVSFHSEWKILQANMNQEIINQEKVEKLVREFLKRGSKRRSRSDEHNDSILKVPRVVLERLPSLMPRPIQIPPDPLGDDVIKLEDDSDEDKNENVFKETETNHNMLPAKQPKVVVRKIEELMEKRTENQPLNDPDLQLPTPIILNEMMSKISQRYLKGDNIFEKKVVRVNFKQSKMNEPDTHRCIMANKDDNFMQSSHNNLNAERKNTTTHYRANVAQKEINKNQILNTSKSKKHLEKLWKGTRTYQSLPSKTPKVVVSQIEELMENRPGNQSIKNPDFQRRTPVILNKMMAKTSPKHIKANYIFENKESDRDRQCIMLNKDDNHLKPSHNNLNAEKKNTTTHDRANVTQKEINKNQILNTSKSNKNLEKLWEETLAGKKHVIYNGKQMTLEKIIEESGKKTFYFVGKKDGVSGKTERIKVVNVSSISKTAELPVLSPKETKASDNTDATMLDELHEASPHEDANNDDVQFISQSQKKATEGIEKNQKPLTLLQVLKETAPKPSLAPNTTLPIPKDNKKLTLFDVLAKNASENSKAVQTEEDMMPRPEKNVILDLQKEIVNLRSHIEALENYIKKQSDKPRKKERNPFQKVAKDMNVVQKVFVNMQMKNAKKKSSGRRFTSEEIKVAHFLYKRSREGYKMWRDIFILPNMRTVGRFKKILTKQEPDGNAAEETNSQNLEENQENVETTKILDSMKVLRGDMRQIHLRDDGNLVLAKTEDCPDSNVIVETNESMDEKFEYKNNQDDNVNTVNSDDEICIEKNEMIDEETATETEYVFYDEDGATKEVVVNDGTIDFDDNVYVVADNDVELSYEQDGSLVVYQLEDGTLVTEAPE